MPAQLWYVRRGARVQGPFPRGLIVRYIVLGRIGENDELSVDQKLWQPLAELPELVPEAVVENGERLIAMRRWESDRVADRRSLSDADYLVDEQRRSDRRTHDDSVPHAVMRPDDLELRAARRQRLRRLFVGVLLAAVFAVSSLLVRHRAPAPQAVVDCTLAPQAGVMWNSCDLTGHILAKSDLTGASMNSAALVDVDLREARLKSADLAFANLARADLRKADLSSARLMGASLHDAVLDGARLDGADLSYADLRGASMEGVSLSGVRLDSALWLDGTSCAAGSMGECRGLAPVEVMPDLPAASSSDAAA
ncbi:MAG: pentapeptide repeat-containing protein, partial [Chromatiales bacterium]|nr:pentapeptide repeat-containing protein [Chromatiales bacterium]